MSSNEGNNDINNDFHYNNNNKNNYSATSQNFFADSSTPIQNLPTQKGKSTPKNSYNSNLTENESAFIASEKFQEWDNETRYEEESTEDGDFSDVYDPLEALNQEKDLVRTPLQKRCFEFFERPKSIWAKLFWVVSSLCVLTTITMICIESLPNVSDDLLAKLDPIDITVAIIFTIEYIGRFYASVNKLVFFRQFMNIVDLLSILPFYLELVLPIAGGSALRYLRILRLFRILKVFHFVRNSVVFNITFQVFKRSVSQIAMVLMWVFIIILMSSAIMYYLERGEFHNDDHTWYRTRMDGTIERSPFQSIVHSFWWAIVTITTVGYGDDIPISGWGKLLSGLTALCGIMVIAIPTSIIGSNFITVWDAYRRKKMLKRIHRESAHVDDTLEKQQTKKQRLKILRDQNDALLQVLAEFQDRLNELNPPKYKEQCQKLSEQNKRYKSQILRLEFLLKEYQVNEKSPINGGSKLDSYRHDSSYTDDLTINDFTDERTEFPKDNSENMLKSSNYVIDKDINDENALPNVDTSKKSASKKSTSKKSTFKYFKKFHKKFTHGHRNNETDNTLEINFVREQSDNNNNAEVAQNYGQLTEPSAIHYSISIATEEEIENINKTNKNNDEML
ncbi:1660_t:CDS:2 [Ambispora gerdemannii]|uniref:1660_t:CDS:1 n=1 Tax=Ambispora gerdemannii TaxID=144530 RepID=A0A9N9BQ57_9GLOM|nr:1660_t:CDS:2 [Ambispora gerdemannii]